MGVAMGRSMSTVGTWWSSVASVRSGRRTDARHHRSPSKACGLVTSCTGWRSMYSGSGCTFLRVHDVRLPDLLRERQAHLDLPIGLRNATT